MNPPAYRTGRVWFGGVWAPGGLPGLQNRGTARCVVGGFDSRPPPLTCGNGVWRAGWHGAADGLDLGWGNNRGTPGHDRASSIRRATASAAALCAAASMWV